LLSVMSETTTLSCVIGDRGLRLPLQ